MSEAIRLRAAMTAALSTVSVRLPLVSDCESALAACANGERQAPPEEGLLPLADFSISVTALARIQTTKTTAAEAKAIKTVVTVGPAARATRTKDIAISSTISSIALPNDALAGLGDGRTEGPVCLQHLPALVG